MGSDKVTIWIDNENEFDVFEDYQNVIETVVKACIEEENYPSNIEVSISIVDNKEIQRLNLEFRNIDRATDVLSFPMINFNNNLNLDSVDIKDCINIDTKEIVLGDIIISVEQARKQALEFNHSLKREIAFLTAHSMFHLMGYDHEDIDEEKVMIEKQEKVLSKIGITR